MTIDTQNHIRDTITILLSATAGTAAIADVIKPISDISPQFANAAPVLIASVPLVHALIGIAFRIWNKFYPPVPEATKGTPSNP